jgi:hypothetical protein
MFPLSLAVLTFLVMPVLFGCLRAPAFAEPPRAPFLVADDDDDSTPSPDVRVRNAGVIEGQVVAVDYRTDVIAVQTSSRRYQIVVLPSTNIQGHSNTFHTIADISKGERVQIYMSQRGNSFVAQIIHLH